MSYMDNFSKEELQKIVDECTSMRELARKCGYYSIGNNDRTIKKKLQEFQISIDHFTGRAKNQIVRNDENVFCEESTATQAVLRRHYEKIFPQQKCAICGQNTIWNNKPLTLTLDHINGNNHDNRLENLRWVCPNCDRQLSTFAGRNVSHIQKNINNKNITQFKVSKPISVCKVCGKPISNYTKTQQCPECYTYSIRVTERPDRDTLKELIRNVPFTTIAKQFNVTDNAIRKWCDQYKLPRKKSDIKQYTDKEWNNI